MVKPENQKRNFVSKCIEFSFSFSCYLPLFAYSHCFSDTNIIIKHMKQNMEAIKRGRREANWEQGWGEDGSVWAVMCIQATIIWIQECWKQTCYTTTVMPNKNLLYHSLLNPHSNFFFPSLFLRFFFSAEGEL